MASRAEEEQQRREERERAEQSAAQGERRQRFVKLASAAFFLAVIAVVAAIVASQSGGGGGGGGGGGEVQAVGLIRKQLQGLEQNGAVLGDPRAPVTLIEYGDLQCPACKAYSFEVIPKIIEGPVRAGKAKIEFRNWTIIGPQSKLAAKASLAAGRQRRMWSFIELFYRNQGAENSGYVSDDFLTSIAKSAGVKDINSWNRDRNLKRWDATLAKSETAARRYGFEGTPSFLVRGPSGVPGPVGEITSPEDLLQAIARAR